MVKSRWVLVGLVLFIPLVSFAEISPESLKGFGSSEAHVSDEEGGMRWNGKPLGGSSVHILTAKRDSVRSDT